jgi:hypothetical protein
MNVKGKSKAPKEQTSMDVEVPKAEEQPVKMEVPVAEAKPPKQSKTKKPLTETVKAQVEIPNKQYRPTEERFVLPDSLKK